MIEDDIRFLTILFIYPYETYQCLKSNTSGVPKHEMREYAMRGDFSLGMFSRLIITHRFKRRF
jgi:hypothetical protein